MCHHLHLVGSLHDGIILVHPNLGFRDFELFSTTFHPDQPFQPFQLVRPHGVLPFLTNLSAMRTVTKLPISPMVTQHGSFQFLLLLLITLASRVQQLPRLLLTQRLLTTPYDFTMSTSHYLIVFAANVFYLTYLIFRFPLSLLSNESFRFAGTAASNHRVPHSPWFLPHSLVFVPCPFLAGAMHHEYAKGP
ncbi:hypothetical protein DL96DRAFT_1181090 [Flagelloscypha sp. PMI_526]|nr:hypothetical protein DL96DRAFT_1181090 [Flagelloscypha sp. PMI_526]